MINGFRKSFVNNSDISGGSWKTLRILRGGMGENCISSFKFDMKRELGIRQLLERFQ